MSSPSLPNSSLLSPGALDGIRVLDFTGVIAGPYCARLMADLGAEVIKIEPPNGDLLRVASPRRKGRTPYFAQLNAGKDSISIDLKEPGAVELVLDLVEKADVAIQNFRPGVLADFGLGYEAMKARKSDIVYCNLSGYGQEGPARNYSAYAPIVHASAGLDLTMVSHQDDQGTPLNGSVPFADYLTGVHGTTAIMAALFRRERTGQGDEIDIAMADVIINIQAFELQETQHPLPVDRILYRPLKAKDGLFVVTPLSGKNFRDLINAVGHPEWAEEMPLDGPDFALNWRKLLDAVEVWATDRTAEECEQIISAGGCPVARHRSVLDALQSEQSLYRGNRIEMDDGGGKFYVPNTPLRMRNSEASLKPTTPTLGQGNESILKNWLDMSADEISNLTKKGILFKPKKRTKKA